MTRTTDMPVVGDMLLSGATSVGAGNPVSGRPVKKTFQADLVGTGAAASVIIEGSNTGSGWVTLAQIDLTTASPSDGFYYETPLAYIRARVSAISGTGAAVSCGMGS